MAIEMVPYSNFHDLNLDWILKTVQEVQSHVDGVDALVDDAEEYRDQARSAAESAAQSVVDASDYANTARGYAGNAADAYDQTLDLYNDLSGTIQQEVSDWLTARVDPETGYVLDDSLTIQGAAADAKAAGDRIEEATELANTADFRANLAAMEVGRVATNFADPYIETLSYVPGDFCIYDNILRKCVVATTGTFNASAWQIVTAMSQISGGGADAVRSPTRLANISRTARYLDQYVKNNTTRALYAQGAVYDGSNIIFCGSYNNNATQVITKIDKDTGAIGLSASFTDLGHANDIAVMGDTIYIADGLSAEVHCIDKAALTFIETKQVTGFTAVYGVAVDNGKLYAFANDCTLLVYNEMSNSFDTVSSFTRPANNTMQGSFVVRDGYAYILFAQSNEVYKVDIASGVVIGSFMIPDGDGLRPCGECEDLLINNGRIYLLSAPAMENTYSTSGRCVSIAQIFDTDIDQILEGTVVTSYNVAGSPVNITCNGNAAYELNPGKTVTTIEEACMILNYAKSGHVLISNITEGYAFLHGGVYTLRGSGTISVLDFYDARAICSQFYVTKLYVRHSRLNLRALQHFTEILTQWSEVVFDRVHLTDLLTWTSYRSSIKFNLIRGIASGITFTITEPISCSVEYKGQYLSNVLQLFKLAGTAGSGHKGVIRLYDESADSIGCGVDLPTLQAGTAIVYPLANSTYDNVKIEGNKIYLDTSGTYSEASTTCVLEFFGMRNS